MKRNWYRDVSMPQYSGYVPTVAHAMATDRRRRLSKLHRDRRLAALVVACLHQAWSPEQIAGRLRLEGLGRTAVCHETIYQYVCGPAGRAGGLSRLLPSRRRRRYARKPRGLFVPEPNTIKKRPLEINARVGIGHWECDLVGFRQVFGQSKLTTLVERVSHYLVLARTPSRHSAGVMTGIAQGLSPLPSAYRQSITFDRGSEFAGFATLRATLRMESYFCAPHAPWQKGTVENTNGRLRRFLPLDTDLRRIPPKIWPPSPLK